jgi:WD40 repeat protein
MIKFDNWIKKLYIMKQLKFSLLSLFLLFCPALNAQQPEVVIQIGHMEKINSIDISPDGKWVISASSDQTVKLWDIETGKELRTFSGHANEIYAVAFLQDGKSFISVSSDKTSKQWNIEKENEVKTFAGHTSDIRALSINPNGKTFITGSFDNTVRLWDIESGTLIKKFIHEGKDCRITSVAFSPDGKQFVSGNSENTVKLWDVETGAELKTYSGHTDWVWSVGFCSSGNKIVSGSGDKKLAIWNVNDEKDKIFIDNGEKIKTVASSPNGIFFAIGGSNGTITLYDLSGKKIKTFSGHTSTINSLVFSKCGKVLVSGSDDKTISLWDVENGVQIKTLKGSTSLIYSISQSVNGKNIATGNGDKTIKLWDLERGRIVETFTGHTYFVNSVSFSPDGRKLASGTWDETVKIWDVVNGKELLTLKGHDDFVSSVAYSPDGKRVLSGSNDNQIKQWDIEKGAEINTLKGHSHAVATVAYSPDGKRIVSGSYDRTIMLWDARNAKKIKTFEGHTDPILSVSITPDGKSIVSGSWDKTIKLWDISTGKELRSFLGHDSIVTSVSVSLDSRFIISGSQDKSVRLWDISTGKEVKKLVGHTNFIKSVLFSNNGKEVFSGARDGKVTIWSIETGQEIASLISINENDYLITTPDSYYLTSRGAFNGVAFRVGNKVYPFEQFDLRLNRPDIILERLGYASPQLISSYKNAYLKRLKKMNFTEDMLGGDFHLPELTLSTHNIPISTTSKSLTISVEAKDSKYLLDRLNVYINDVPIYGTNGIDLRGKKISDIKQNIILQLMNGNNKVQVSVLNSKGAESLKQTFNVKYAGPEVKPQLHIVSIGISEFKDANYNLTYASKDANDIASSYRQSGVFSNVVVHPFINDNATKENILKVKEILMKTKVDDYVLLFVASHGLLDNNLNYFIATYDIDFNNPSAKGLPYEEMENILDGIPALKKLILIDACHSGEVDKDDVMLADAIVSGGAVSARGFKTVKKKEDQLGVENSFELMQELFADLRRGTGAMVISSAGGAEFAFESSEWKNGVFTYSVLEGIRTGKADANRDGEIRVSELRDYVFARVKELTQGKQNPTSRQENLEFDFRVW